MSQIKAVISKNLELYIENLYVYERETYIELSIITIKKEFRNQGYASLIMKQLCSYADDVKKPILLTPDVPEGDYEGLNNSELVKFYEKFGFCPNKGSIRDYSMPSHSYKRLPQ